MVKAAIDQQVQLSHIIYFDELLQLNPSIAQQHHIKYQIFFKEHFE